jgi:hypothetical protein
MGAVHMRKYPHAVTKKCSKCGKTFTCKGTTWVVDPNTGKCPHAKSICECEQCHHGKSRPKGCEEIELGEKVTFD